MASNKPKKRGNRAGDNKKMGTKRSKRHRHEDLAAPGDSCLIDAIDHEDFRRLWSYNSTSGGRYVYITNDTAPEDSSAYVVEATGEPQATTDIRFDLAPNSNNFQPTFQMKFNKGTTWYAVNASENSVTASAEVTNTSFEVMELWTPNKPYVVLRSNKMSGNEYLYLSSNGAGNMQLKVWNKPVPGPPNTTSEADPALLFRVVRPFGQD